MSATASLLASLDAIAHEMTSMLSVLDTGDGFLAHDRREAKMRVLEIRARAQELFDWLAATRQEEQLN
jgi:repressor of nif and glnA expression